MERDPNDVLHEFIELCNDSAAHMLYHLAANSVLELFVGTIRGRMKIKSYYRYDLCHKYKHEFEKAESCEAFECKPSHMQTKIIADEDKIQVPISLTATTADDFTSTPPHQRIGTPPLPKVDRGTTFITTPENSPSSSSQRAQTPHNITPPQNIIKPRKSDDTDESPPIKRLKFESPQGCAGDSSSSNVSKSTQSDCIATTPENGQGDVGTTTSLLSSAEVTAPHQHNEGTTIAQSDTGYSELKYIQSVGVLHTQPKHRGMGRSSNFNLHDLNSPTTTTPNGVKTKLKLSYRIRKHDNQIQFALIIYENLSRNTALRRNLFTEFQQTDSDAGASPKTSPAKSLPATPSPAKNLKRSHRLF